MRNWEKKISVIFPDFRKELISLMSSFLSWVCLF